MSQSAAAHANPQVTVHAVRFLPSGRSTLVEEGTTLLRAALDGGMPLGSSCDGAGICRACRVQVLQGAENLSPQTDFERSAATGQSLTTNERFACLARVQGPVSITTSYW